MNLCKIHESKKGVASLYAVIFATILFGVITLSFIRIILSEARQSDDDELSQSAYDSALAGVEDAKRAVNIYYECLNSASDPATCAAKYPFDDDCASFSGNSGKLKTVLGYNVEGEIKIQEESTAKGKANETSIDQAYTCIRMTDETDDYRSTLTNDTRVRVVPLGIGSDKLKSVSEISFSWFSENNGTDIENRGLYENRALKTKGADDAIPVISLTLLYTKGETFNISSFNKSTNDADVLYSTMILLPAKEGISDLTSTLDSSTISDAGNSDTKNLPFLIECKKREFACVVSLEPDFSGSNKGNALLIASMPYGGKISDFAVKMYDSSGNTVKFKGAQISVDSTGRANQLYRRVETRLDPADSFFPYPQFAVELDGEGGSELKKNFWITYNCWTEAGSCPNNGDL